MSNSPNPSTCQIRAVPSDEAVASCVEIKWRKAEWGIRQFSRHWEGEIQPWIKWSCHRNANRINDGIYSTTH